jgi:hypothetical protein
MSEIETDGARTFDGHPSMRGHIWLEGIQDDLLGRLSEIASDAAAEVTERKVLPIDRATPHTTRAGLVERLKDRKIVQWLLAYLAVGWMILQLNDVLAEVWGVPLTAQKVISLGLGVGILPAVVVAWYHGEKGRQRVCCTEVGLVGLTIAIALLAVWRVCFA